MVGFIHNHAIRSRARHARTLPTLATVAGSSGGGGGGSGSGSGSSSGFVVAAAAAAAPELRILNMQYRIKNGGGQTEEDSE